MKTKENIDSKKYKVSAKAKRAISLIVLVITIIVIIILATAIIVTLLGNNPIKEANKARYESDRDSMQAIFTNTVAKVMAKTQSTMEIKAGALNKVTSGVNSATGEAKYILNNPEKSEGKEGKIIFDNKENTDNEYYTGRKLPIYNAGETTWYVDEEGIITLQVGEETYGEGKKESLNEKIKIGTKVKENSDYTKASIEIEIEYEGEIESVLINGEEIEVIKNEEGKYVGKIEVSENGNYNVIVVEKNGTRNKEVVKVDVITEDMEIWNREDMEKFRDRVNSGRTYEGRTVKVMADIELEGSSNNWIPIANYTINNSLRFKGIFEGNNKTISGLYINTSNGYQGLFGINDGEIKNIKVNGQINVGGAHSGGIVGYNNGIINNCHNSVSIDGNGIAIGGITGLNNSGNITNCSNLVTLKGYAVVGGIAGDNRSNINACFNKGNISAGYQTAGGIIGYHVTGNIYNCYNTSSVVSGSGRLIGGINGAAGESGRTTAYTYNCYNIGSISGLELVGNITGWSNANGGSSQDINCYTTNVTVTGLNNGSYSENVWKEDKEPNINNGYPILNWQ